MNYLAHLFLSCEDEELLIGNYLADFVKNRYRDVLSARVIEGIKLHQTIDHFTDQHPQVLQGVRRLYPRHHKYAPVLTDIFYDYLLVENWERYSNESLEDFTKRVYDILMRHIEIIPAPFQARTINMVQHDWLMSYSTLEGISDTFERMKHRVSKPQYLDDAALSLQEHQAELTTEFNIFFPELFKLVQESCFC